MCANHTMFTKAMTGQSPFKGSDPNAKGGSTLTVKTNNPNAYAPGANDVDTKRPNAPPDLTDEAVKMARRSELARLMSGMGRRSTFLAGPMNTFGNFGKSLLGG